MFVVESPKFVYRCLIKKSTHVRSTYLNAIMSCIIASFVEYVCQESLEWFKGAKS